MYNRKIPSRLRQSDKENLSLALVLNLGVNKMNGLLRHLLFEEMPYNVRLLAHHHHYHQPINVPTAGAQAFLMEDT
jgi:hypothetical protein